MFYAEAILSRRGPLGKVWLAAHWERKLSKTQTLQTDIGQSVDAIVNQEVVPMALRLSGQLLLGVCRIYSRKAKYLLDDCNEALLKIKMAFRPGLVDMTGEQLAVTRDAITLQGDALNFDLLLGDANWDFDIDQPIKDGQEHVAKHTAITLIDNNDMNFNLPDANYGFDLDGIDDIGSQDYMAIDIDFGEEVEVDQGKGKGKARATTEDQDDDDMSVGRGRDANMGDPRVGRPSLESALDKGHHGSDFDEFDTRSRGGIDMEDRDDFNMEGVVVDIDFGDEENNINLMDREKTPEAVRDGSRASTPRSAPPATPPPQEEAPQVIGESTPRAEDAIAAIEAPVQPKKKTHPKKQIIDAVTEMEDGPGTRPGRATTRDLSEITAEPDYLPRSRTVMALMHIRADPLAHFMPTTTNERGTFFCAAPIGMAPELAQLFMFPARSPHARRRDRARSVIAEDRSPKRARMATEDPEVELGRREPSIAPSLGVRSDLFGKEMEMDGGEPSFGRPDDSFGMEDTNMQLDDGQLDVDLDNRAPSSKRKSPEIQTVGPKTSEAGDNDHVQLGEDVFVQEEDRRSRYSTPAAGEDVEGARYSDLVCPIAIFDSRPSQNTQSQTQEAEETGENKDGYSKNTVKAMGVLRRHFAVGNDSTPRQGSKENVISFKRLTEKASRRAASAFFFELLVLGTRDCIKLNQPGAFENVEITPKDKFWTTEGNERQPSMAPSDI